MTYITKSLGSMGYPRWKTLYRGEDREAAAIAADRTTEQAAVWEQEIEDGVVIWSDEPVYRNEPLKEVRNESANEV